jgi:hypothetical protein
MRAAGLEDVGEADQVALQVGGGIFRAVADVGLCTEVNDVVRLKVLENPAELRRVGKVRAHETEALQLLQPGQPRALQLDRVVVVEVVEAEHLATLG